MFGHFHLSCRFAGDPSFFDSIRQFPEQSEITIHRKTTNVEYLLIRNRYLLSSIKHLCSCRYDVHTVKLFSQFFKYLFRPDMCTFDSQLLL